MRQGSVALDPRRVLTAIDRSAADAGFVLDATQIRAAHALCAAAERLRVGEAPAVYLWGPVGRGKTWLLDAFVRGLGETTTRRFHFHRFFRAFHEARNRHGFGPRSVRRALDDLIGDAELVCFDELFAHETGDARLFTAILTELRERQRVPMVVTSNYPPEGLLPDAEFKTSGSTWEEPAVKIDHRAFADGIALMKREFEIVAIDGGTDYRELASPDGGGFRSGTFRVNEGPHAGDRCPSTAVVAIRGRELRARAVDDDQVVFDFAELCERPVGSGDVAELTARFRSWTIEDVPPLGTCSPEGAQRLVNFVDVLCDADVRVDITSRCSLDDLFGGESLPPDVARLRSRLRLLQR